MLQVFPQSVPLISDFARWCHGRGESSQIWQGNACVSCESQSTHCIHPCKHAFMHACMHTCKHAHMHTCKRITKHRFSQVEVMKLPKAGCLVNVPHNCVFHAATSTLRNQDGSGFYDAKRRDIAHRVFYWTHVASSPGVRTDHPGHSTGLGVNLCCCMHAIMSTHGSIMHTHTYVII